MPSVEAHSALLWGRNSPVRRGMVRIACEELGIVNSHLYREPHSGWALREAVKDVAASCRSTSTKTAKGGAIEIRPLDTPLSYEAVHVHRRIIQNSEEFLFSVQLIADAVVVLRAARRLDSNMLSQKVKFEMDTRKTWMNASQVRNLMDRVVAHVGGIDLGGVNTFYLPPPAVAKVAGFKARAGLAGYGLTRFSISTDPATFESVTSALRAEVQAQIAEIKEKVDGGDMTRKSALALSRQASALESKVRMYESSIGLSLPDLTDAISQACSSAAIAGLLAAAV